MTTVLFEPDLRDRVVRENMGRTLLAFVGLPEVSRLVVIAEEGARAAFEPFSRRLPNLHFFPWEQQNNYALLRAALAYPSRTYVRVRGAWAEDTVRRFVIPVVEHFVREGGIIAHYRPELVRLAGTVSRSHVELFDRTIMSRLAAAAVKISPDGMLGQAVERPLGLFSRNYSTGGSEELIHFFVDFSEIYAPYPQVVWISPTNLCNFRCENCFIYQHRTAAQRSYFQSKVMLDPGLWHHIVDDIVSWTPAINIKMGSIEEPLTHPDVPGLVQYAKSRGVSCVYILTNGALLNPRLDEALIMAGLDRIFISVNTDHPERFQENVKYDYNEISNNIRELIRTRSRLGRDKPEVFVAVIADSPDARLPSLERWLCEVDGVVFTSYIGFEGNDATMPRFRSLFRPLPRRVPCQELWGNFILHPGGEAVPCVIRQKMLDGVDVTFSGSLKTHSFMEVFHSDLMKKLRREQILGQFNERSPCPGCEFWSLQLYETVFEDASVAVRESPPFCIVCRKPGAKKPNLGYFRQDGIRPTTGTKT